MTVAQLRVLDYLPTRLTYTEIAGQLFVSRNTVKTHAIAIFRKLGVSSRSEAIVIAHRLDLLDNRRKRTRTPRQSARSSAPLHLVGDATARVEVAPHDDFVLLSTAERSLLSDLLASAPTDEPMLEALARKLDGRAPSTAWSTATT
jgi:DNA-binding CsgD family transcriptional regulator